MSSAPVYRRFGFALPVLASLMVMEAAHSQTTNSWIDSSDGKWEKKHHWDDGLPSVNQSAVIISNANSKVVTIDARTTHSFPNSLTISNLTVSAQDGGINTLFLDNTGTVALHILNGFTIGIIPDPPFVGPSELISANSTLIVDGLLGGQLEDDGTMVIVGGSLITTNCSLNVADNAPGFLMISNALTQARDVTVTFNGGESSSGTLEIMGGTMILSSSLSVGSGGAGFGFSQGNLFVANGGLLVVTNGATGIGVGHQTGGSVTVSNATFLAADIFLGGLFCGGELTINNGTVTLSGELGIGGYRGAGDVILDGGMFVVTNDIAVIANEQSFGALTISDGIFLGQTVLVGGEVNSEGIFSIQGGISILSSNLQIGGAFSFATVSMTDGQLFVTNASIVIDSVDEAQCVVSGGQLSAKAMELEGFSGGTLMVNGGSVTVSEGITLGDCNESFDVGYASVDGGQLTVTNAASTGFIDVRSGVLTLESGTLQVDKLVMTNTCGSFVHTGGTLIVGSVILDPNAFRIVSVTPQGNDMLVTWMMGPGATNTLQAACRGTGGSCTMSGFADIFIVTNNTKAGCITNYLDVGAVTNVSSRYYRARLSP